MFKKHPNETPHLAPGEFGELRSADSILTDKRGLSTSIAESLGSIGLGILLLVTVAVGIGAAINFGQDSSAQNSLDAVKSAQLLHQAKTGSFGDIDALTTGQDPVLSKTPGSLAIVVGDRNFCAAVESGSMFKTNYWLTGKSGEILKTKPTVAEAGITCPEPITS